MRTFELRKPGSQEIFQLLSFSGNAKQEYVTSTNIKRHHAKEWYGSTIDCEGRVRTTKAREIAPLIEFTDSRFGFSNTNCCMR